MKSTTVLIISALLVSTAFPQDIRQEMERVRRFGDKAPSLVTGNEVRTYWTKDAAKLAYRVDTEANGWRYFQVDLKTGAKSPAFDHEKLAIALSKAANHKVREDQLPLEQVTLTPDPGVVRFRAFEKSWSFRAADSCVSPDDMPPESTALLAPEDALRGSRRTGEATSLTIENATAGEIEMFWVEGRGEKRSYGRVAAGRSVTESTYAGHVWLITEAAGDPLAGVEAQDAPSVARITGKIERPPRRPKDISPDGMWRAVILRNNLSLEPVAGGDAIPLTTDGNAEDGYTGPFHWSPDSKRLIAWRLREVKPRQIHIVQSSPPDQLQPKLLTLDYPKPGDPIPQPKPRLFDIGNRREIPVDDALFRNPWEISHGAWAEDSSEFTFVYNQRGHQVMRIAGIRGDSGSARTIYEDTSRTFIDYSQKFWLHRLLHSREFLWASERDGHNHIYRIDGASGRIVNAVTHGDWNVREVVEVDEAKHRLLLKINGVPGSDPYYEHFAWVNFDGSGFTRLTAGDGTHKISFSPDRNWIIDTWSRVDQPPVMELRRAANGSLVAELARADDAALRKAGWSRPERFTAAGRDGKTAIYGIIVRPLNFDPAKTYPVLENIYAGPHDFFVPKSWAAWSGLQEMAGLGFVVVSIDGMGTNWRSKAFHDVCWKNLADSGFPDRIPWIKAAAASRPWMDLSRVGIYGGSAGGQSALSALLQHGDFYKVGVADCGCHDNRMDKIWWNEAWMGWPVDDSYARNANATYADKLTGDLMLVVGELDHNVDPASSAQVVAALQKAGKVFDFVPVMNADHGAAETPYGKFRRADFLVGHLHAMGFHGE